MTTSEVIQELLDSPTRHVVLDPRKIDPDLLMEEFLDAAEDAGLKVVYGVGSMFIVFKKDPK